MTDQCRINSTSCRICDRALVPFCHGLIHNKLYTDQKIQVGGGGKVGVGEEVSR